MGINPRAEAILELLVETGLALPPTPIYENLRRRGATFSERTVHRQLKRLEEHGLVERVLGSKGYYRATERGEAYVAGEISRADLET